MIMPGISVIIPAYNMADFIGEAIESILRQSFTDFEILLIDDGSSDGTKEVCGRYKDDRIRYYYQTNRGVARARNTGIEKANGKYIAFLDADDVLLSESLSRRYQFAEREDLNLVYSDFYLLKEIADFDHLSKLQGDLERVKYLDRLGNSRLSGENEYVVSREDFILGNLPFIKIWTGTVLVRREWWTRVVNRFFDPIFSIGEDIDMWWYLILHPSLNRLGYIAEPLTVYRYYNNSWTSFDEDPETKALRYDRVFEKAEQYISRREVAKLMYDTLWAYYPGEPGLRRKLLVQIVRRDPGNVFYLKSLLAAIVKSILPGHGIKRPAKD